MVARKLICLLPFVLAVGVYLVHAYGPVIYDDFPFIVNKRAVGVHKIDPHR